MIADSEENDIVAPTISSRLFQVRATTLDESKHTSGSTRIPAAIDAHRPLRSSLNFANRAAFGGDQRQPKLSPAHRGQPERFVFCYQRCRDSGNQRGPPEKHEPGLSDDGFFDEPASLATKLLPDYDSLAQAEMNLASPKL